jgi:hypothetical protein
MFGDQSPYVAVQICDLARMISDERDYKDAEALILQALQMFDKDST